MSHQPNPTLKAAIVNTAVPDLDRIEAAVRYWYRNKAQAFISREAVDNSAEIEVVEDAVLRFVAYLEEK